MHRGFTLVARRAVSVCFEVGAEASRCSPDVTTRTNEIARPLLQVQGRRANMHSSRKSTKRQPKREDRPRVCETVAKSLEVCCQTSCFSSHAALDERDEDDRRNLACPNRQCRVPVGMDAKSGAACSFEEQTGLSEWALRRISLVFGIWIVVMQGALRGLGFVHHVRRHWVVETSTHLRQWAMASGSTHRVRVRPWRVRGGEAPREIIHMMARVRRARESRDARETR